MIDITNSQLEDFIKKIRYPEKTDDKELLKGLIRKYNTSMDDIDTILEKQHLDIIKKENCIHNFCVSVIVENLVKCMDCHLNNNCQGCFIVNKKTERLNIYRSSKKIITCPKCHLKQYLKYCENCLNFICKCKN
jgi:hypothetical protein